MIADCHADYTVIPKEQEIANAKLIAAAPDLVEAIQWAITALADDGGMIDTGELIATVDKVRKRLQKAMKPLI
jgi:hypothetical protein